MKYRVLMFVPLVTLATHSQAATQVEFPSTEARQAPFAYQQIAKAQRVPPLLLFSLCKQESGATLHSGEHLPWPWTLNIAGQGQHFHTRVEAHHALANALQQERLVDVGLCQINWQYNGHYFGNPWAALDPYENLRVAAHLLRSHYNRTGDWWKAVGHYHSPGKKAAQRQRARQYAQRVQGRYQQLAWQL